jgi:hypothetical protein
MRGIRQFSPTARALKKYQHIFGDVSITLKMMLLIAGGRQDRQEGELP